MRKKKRRIRKELIRWRGRSTNSPTLVVFIIHNSSFLLMIAASVLAQLASATSWLEGLYGQPMAIQETYSCCVYRGGFVQDFECEDIDTEC